MSRENVYDTWVLTDQQGRTAPSGDDFPGTSPLVFEAFSQLKAEGVKVPEFMYFNGNQPQLNLNTIMGEYELITDEEVLNRYQSGGKCSVEKTDDALLIRVPSAMLGFGNVPVKFEFKWADNSVTDGDAMDFYDQGDAAPLGRFNYRYCEE